MNHVGGTLGGVGWPAINILGDGFSFKDVLGIVTPRKYGDDLIWRA